MRGRSWFRYFWGGDGAAEADAPEPTGLHSRRLGPSATLLRGSGQDGIIRMLDGIGRDERMSIGFFERTDKDKQQR